MINRMTEQDQIIYTAYLDASKRVRTYYKLHIDKYELKRAADFKCSACHIKTKALEIHHIISISDGVIRRLTSLQINDASNLQVLCHDCHVAVHLNDDTRPASILKRLYERKRLA